MTRDQLELALRREGLTRPQVEAAMSAADAYAFAQCKAAVNAVDMRSRPVLIHFLTGARPACGVKNEDAVNTILPHRVTCGNCQQTSAWKAAA